jgi:hypothetical protein
VRSGDALGELEELFQRAVQAPRLLEGELELRVAARAPGSLADEVASAAEAHGAPAPLERCVRNRLRSGGEALWVTAEGESALTLARAGSGRTAFLASRPGAGWAPRHAESADPGFAGVLRWLARGVDHGVRPRARLEAGRLWIRGLAPGTPAELHGALFAADGRPRIAELVLTPPGMLGLDVLRTREARVGEEWDGTDLVVRYHDGEVQRSVAVERALSEELAWRERPVPRDWPRPLLSGGTARASRPMAAWATALGLVLLFAAGVAGVRGQGVAQSSR